MVPGDEGFDEYEYTDVDYDGAAHMWVSEKHMIATMPQCGELDPLSERVWLQGTIVQSRGSEVVIDDGSGVVNVDLCGLIHANDADVTAVGVYCMVLGTSVEDAAGHTKVGAHIIKDLGSDPNSESTWLLEVTDCTLCSKERKKHPMQG